MLRSWPLFSARVWLALVTIYLVWGSTFIALAITVRDLPPLLSMAIRHLIAGALLLAWALPRGDREGDRIGRPQVLAGFVFGGLLFLLGHGSLAWAQQTVPAGVAALLVGSIPIWMALLDRIVSASACALGVRRLRARLRRARVPHRPVRRRPGRPRRRPRHRPRGAGLVRGLPLLARRRPAEAPARLRRAGRDLRRHPPAGGLDRRRRARPGDLDRSLLAVGYLVVVSGRPASPPTSGCCAPRPSRSWRRTPT